MVVEGGRFEGRTGVRRKKEELQGGIIYGIRKEAGMWKEES
jgi:hypothetical protein